MNMNLQKGFIQIPILIAIIIGVVLVGGVSYVSVRQYQSYRAEKIEKEKQAQEKEIAFQAETKVRQKAIEEAQRKKDLEVEKLRQELEVLKKKEPQIVQQTIIKEVPAPKIINDLPTIIKQWRPKIAHITCEWRDISTSGSGSGILINTTDSKDGLMLAILTNKHVIITGENYSPDLCDILLPDMDTAFRVIDREMPDGTLYTFRKSSSGLDWGLIRLEFPSDYMKTLASSGVPICKETASVGDSIVILGYPGIGSQTDITATEGIISGRDGSHYITSAKIERGNSGGVAISVKNNCYLGIPTFAKAGEIESLARILDVRAIFNSF